MANPDPFLRSMALWILKDFTGSLNTLVQTNVGTMHPQYNDEEKQETSAGTYIKLSLNSLIYINSKFNHQLFYQQIQTFSIFMFIFGHILY